MTPTTTPTATTTPQAPPPSPKPRRTKPGGSVVLHCVPWEMYTKLVKAFGDKRNVRLTYDNEELEIMVPSLDHDFSDRAIAAMIPILTEEFGFPIRAGGQTTMKRRMKLKGIEADDIFWIANAAKLAGVRELDLKFHPPPDLATEVDVSHSSVKRLRIYAALGVPEVWRLDGDTLTFHILSGKKYSIGTHSRSFPLIAPGDLMPFVQQARGAGDQNPIFRAFRAWVQQRVAAQPAVPPPPP